MSAARERPGRGLVDEPREVAIERGDQLRGIRLRIARPWQPLRERVRHVDAGDQEPELTTPVERGRGQRDPRGRALGQRRVHRVRDHDVVDHVEGG